MSCKKLTAASNCVSDVHHFDGHVEGVEAIAIHVASLDAAYPGLLHHKLLDAAIGQILAPYWPGGRQGNSKQNNDVYVSRSTLLAVLMIVAVRRYYTMHIARWRKFMAFIKAMKRRHWASTRSNSIN